VTPAVLVYTKYKNPPVEWDFLRQYIDRRTRQGQSDGVAPKLGGLLSIDSRSEPMRLVVRRSYRKMGSWG